MILQIRVYQRAELTDTLMVVVESHFLVVWLFGRLVVWGSNLS